MSGPRDILVVGADALICALLAETLAEEGYTARSASDGAIEENDDQ